MTQCTFSPFHLFQSLSKLFSLRVRWLYELEQKDAIRLNSTIKIPLLSQLSWHEEFMDKSSSKIDELKNLKFSLVVFCVFYFI